MHDYLVKCLRPFIARCSLAVFSWKRRKSILLSKLKKVMKQINNVAVERQSWQNLWIRWFQLVTMINNHLKSFNKVFLVLSALKFCITGFKPVGCMWNIKTYFIRTTKKLRSCLKRNQSARLGYRLKPLLRKLIIVLSLVIGR